MPRRQNYMAFFFEAFFAFFFLFAMAFSFR
jgi:hypothetical protein